MEVELQLLELSEEVHLSQVDKSLAQLLPHVAQNTVIRNSRIGVQGIRGSVVTSPPVYEAVQHPPVYEVITTPPKVYEIVTPVVEVTPDTVIQQ